MGAAGEAAQAERAQWLLYGAYGYTGRLVTRCAIERGERPILAGRDADQLRAMAGEFGLAYRAVPLDDAGALVAALDGVAAVAHCAGPFSTTALPMVDACLAAGVHYLDINGDIAVFEEVFARDGAARERGVVLLPGAGFDVVPTDCLAAGVAAALPGATQLEIAFRASGGQSRGTARSAIANLGAISLCRIGGEIRPAPRSRRRLRVRLGGDDIIATAASWGDVSTAHHSTGIDDVFVYIALPAPLVLGARAASALARAPGLRWPAVRAMSWAAGRGTDPTGAERASSGSDIWARASSADGASIERRMSTPNPYDLTADAVVRIARLVADGAVQPGARTPSSALGPDFAASLDGVTVTALERGVASAPR